MAKQRFSSPETEERCRTCLEEFHSYLDFQNKSANTIRAYLFTVRQFYELYPTINTENMLLYKCYLIDHYKPQTVNLRIRAMNCFQEFLNLPATRLLMVRYQRRPFLENVISQADYEYLKNCLLRDGKTNYYFAVRIMAGTGLRISELIQLQVKDIQQGYVDLYSKGNRMRRVYIPKNIRRPCLKWLIASDRTTGYIFLNRSGERITANGIRNQLCYFASIYNLDPTVVHPHSFRHLFAKNFIEHCSDIAMLSDILGHESIETTRIYLHRSSTEQQQIFNQVVNW
ncbi:MAG: tyrosine-type recombinase/integrase [Lachnospiraceae bacterium]|nr:tyrosine-type recombinase/integrase [Lachnospiraceae bacterium]